MKRATLGARVTRMGLWPVRSVSRKGLDVTATLGFPNFPTSLGPCLPRGTRIPT